MNNDNGPVYYTGPEFTEAQMDELRRDIATVYRLARTDDLSLISQFLGIYEWYDLENEDENT